MTKRDEHGAFLFSFALGVMTPPLHLYPAAQTSFAAKRWPHTPTRIPTNSVGRRIMEKKGRSEKSIIFIGHFVI